MSEHVRLEIDDDVAWITLDRPDKHNALSYDDWTDLSRAATAAGADERAQVVVLRGAGERAFCSGADLGELAERDAYAAYENAIRLQSVGNQFAQLRKPTIAMLNGLALAGGLELALCCTFRVASDRAKVGLPEVRMATLAGAGGTQRILRFAPPGVALRMLLLGDLIAAEDALRLGIVDDVVPAERLLDDVTALARRLCENDPRTTALILDAVRVASEGGLASGLAGEAALFGMTTSYDAFRDRIAEFKKK
ncbi:enoyl-CoA hydratase/isomerase family protein [Nocardioides sp. GXZ039]|uniref:enoyl-CoA hydratase/isomerase family protein n=1 Tax=Nocardioides sp. GXZ039 TaxID=3136018 RepID=UPI0030F47AE0